MSYQVIARKYRPHTFDDVIGQEHVKTPLRNAIRTGRIPHAVLLTGPRGTGKTTLARILACCLNAEGGPTEIPAADDQTCIEIQNGNSTDVQEVDAASRTSVDDVREIIDSIRYAAAPGKWRIFIVDEVHMLSTPAFNALLKTLEEPPEHVKFIFCTTDPEKIPITVLSRCQRFDFAPVEADSIVARLRHIVDSEGMKADDDALQLLARRANGSMRDSQSLLEQLLAFCDESITIEDVHRMLGTASGGEIAGLVASIVERDTSAALSKVDQLILGGSDPGQLAEQLLGWFRDMLAATVGCDADLMLNSGPSDFATISEAGKSLGLETMLAMAQIVDETLTRMRQSMHVRTLLEIAVVRVCNLDDLDDLSNLIGQLKTGSIESDSANRPVGRKKPGPVNPPSQPPPQKKSEKLDKTSNEKTSKSVELSPENVRRIWQQALDSLGDTTSEFASQCDSVAISAPNQLVVRFKAEYTLHKERCERPDLRNRLETAVSEVAGRQIRIDFQTLPKEKAQTQTRQPVMTKRQKMREMEKHPFVKEAIETFDAEVSDVISPKRNP